jgi:quinol monooxygenase YgiN
MSEIEGIARLRIHPGKVEELKALQMRCMAVARNRDTGTLRYDVFFNEDAWECIVRERYRDSDALLEHFANLGATASALLQLCSAEGELLGTPSAELRKALGGGPVRVFTPYLSLDSDRRRLTSRCPDRVRSEARRSEHGRASSFLTRRTSYLRRAAPSAGQRAP